MKKLIFIFLFLPFVGFGQSVTLEAGKSLFDHNTPQSVELRSTEVFPLSLKSSQPASGVAFYSNATTFRGIFKEGLAECSIMHLLDMVIRFGQKTYNE